jgi:hypothetical protein
LHRTENLGRRGILQPGDGSLSKDELSLLLFRLKGLKGWSLIPEGFSFGGLSAPNEK